MKQHSHALVLYPIPGKAVCAKIPARSEKIKRLPAMKQAAQHFVGFEHMARAMFGISAAERASASLKALPATPVQSALFVSGDQINFRNGFMVIDKHLHDPAHGHVVPDN